MPDAKTDKTPSFYEYKPGMMKQGGVEEERLFHAMLSKFQKQIALNRDLQQ